MKRAKTIHNRKYSKLISDLRCERKRLGFSQVDIADLLKMKQSEISKIETCERRLDIQEFKELLSIYKIKKNSKLKELVFSFFEIN